MRKANINEDAIASQSSQFPPFVEGNMPNPLDTVNSVEIITVKTMTPYRVVYNTTSTGIRYASMHYLCRRDDNRLLILTRNIIIDSDEDKELIDSLPFVEQDEEYDNLVDTIVRMNLCTYLDNYTTDFTFYVDTKLDGFLSQDDNDSPTIYTYAYDRHNNNEKVKIYIDTNVFSCINFVDNYLFDGVVSIHDLSLAIISASKESETNIPFFYVENIESIEAMAPAEITTEKDTVFNKIKNVFKKKEDRIPVTTIGVVFKISKNTNGVSETALVLAPIDVSVEFDESKFKNLTIASIENDYFGMSDEYVSTLMTNVRLFSEVNGSTQDKEYMIIRGKTKDKKYRLILLDKSAQNKLQEKINEY